jgi:predicted HTH transcriptional regulator
MIDELLQRNEGKTLEFKANAQYLPNILKTVVAFANTSGGTIVIGVEDRTKAVVGVENPLSEEERLTNSIASSISPLIIPDIEIHSYKNKELILIHVPHAVGPYAIKSNIKEEGVYVRFGSTSRLADKDTIRSLKDYARNIYFDEKALLEETSASLDWDVMEKLFKRVRRSITPQNAETIGLLTQHAKKVYPTNGGVILFGKNRLASFPDAIIRCARFLGYDKVNILDHIDIENYLPLAVEEAFNFIRRNTRMGAEIKGLVREDIPEYPVVAVREAILNAVMHADYAMRGTSVTIAIFDDRMEIANPGGLPYGLTIESVLTGSSRVRNRVIARVFKELKWVEQWGTGIKRIMSACLERGLKTPTFEEMNNQFRVTLYATQAVEAVSLESWQSEFISYLKKQGKLSTNEAAAFWDVSPRTARSRLSNLVEKGVIVRSGTSSRDPKGGYSIAGKSSKE